jgi:hypothetical protein
MNMKARLPRLLSSESAYPIEVEVVAQALHELNHLIAVLTHGLLMQHCVQKRIADALSRRV